MGFSTPKQEILKSSPPPPISKNSPKYADHPPNAGHGFAALCIGYLKDFFTSQEHESLRVGVRVKA